MSLAKLRLSPHYGALAKFQASEEGGMCLEGLADGDVKLVKQICQHMDLSMERKDGKVLVRKPGQEFFDALDVDAPGAKDKGGLSDYVARGDLVGAERLARRGVVSQSNLFTALLALPQGADVQEACRLLQAASATAQWPAADARQYFEERARQATVLFLGEARERLDASRSTDTEALLRSGRCQLDVMLSDGRVKGEIVAGTSSYAGGGGRGQQPPPSSRRGLLAGDCASIRPMDGGHFTECEVVVAKPLILRPLTQPPPGTTGSGRSFRVDGLANRQQFSRTITAAHLAAAPYSRQGNCTKDRKRNCGLPGWQRPSDDVLSVLLGRTAKAARQTDRRRPASAVAAGLNQSQREALAEASKACVTLVQGPPGTGKTTVAVRILKHWAAEAGGSSSNGGGVLCASDSNIAVDNIVEGLAREAVSVVRVGRPEAARPEVLEHTAEEIACKRLGLTSVAEANMDQHARTLMRQAVQQVISEAAVVCCTAIGAGGAVLNDHCFSRVLLDEAAQATELASLVPVCRGAQQVVLCGDQCQLPPTVGVDAARHESLEVSLFERLAARSFEPLVLLSAQHRMHPAISAFSRLAFYGGRLMDGVGAADRPAPRGFAWPQAHMPVCFLAARNAPEQRESDSFCNQGEADVVLQVVQDLLRGGLQPHQVGVVAPYAAQVRLLRAAFERAGLPTTRERGGIETNSVDGYQGREKEAIVMCTVRSSATGGLGFLADWRRVNVAFTRARRGLVVIGDPKTLGKDGIAWAPWLRWVRDARCCDRGALDRLPAADKAQRVGLPSADEQGVDAQLAESAAAWKQGLGEAGRWLQARSRSRSKRRGGSEGSEANAKRQKMEGSRDTGRQVDDMDMKRAKKEKKQEKKQEKKRKKKEKKLEKKLQKLAKKKKGKGSSSSTTSSA